MAVYGIQARGHQYDSYLWNVLEYLALFAIVLTHEFGHALACRSVGGQANQIVLWPLGGVAYVAPPQRPGAVLWSIAAGPLVNVILFPVLSAVWFVAKQMNLPDVNLDLYQLIRTIWQINLGLLIFNMLPIYPLDGGQILRSLLWFPFGRANSLMVASIIGFVGVFGIVGLAVFAYFTQDTGSAVWIAIMAAFIGLTCWSGFQQARALMRLEQMPRRREFACPVCHASPPIGEFWVCGRCRKPFDTFATYATCPHCAAQYGVTACVDCGSQRPINEWSSSPIPPRA